MSTPELWKVVLGFVDIFNYWRKTGNKIQLPQDLSLTLDLARYNTVSAYDLEGIHVQTTLVHAIPHFQRIWYVSIDVHSSSSLIICMKVHYIIYIFDLVFL